jgi:hypothetical protein
MGKPNDLVQGTLDLLILKTIALEPKHGWAIAKRIQQVSREVLQVQQGSLYPALHRLRAAGLDQGVVGRIGNRAQGEVLCSDAGRPHTDGSRAGQLGAAFGRDKSGDGNDLMRPWTNFD